MNNIMSILTSLNHDGENEIKALFTLREQIAGWNLFLIQ